MAVGSTANSVREILFNVNTCTKRWKKKKTKGMQMRAEDVLATTMVVKTDVWYKLVIPCFAFPFMGEVARGRSEVQGR